MIAFMHSALFNYFARVELLSVGHSWCRISDPDQVPVQVRRTQEFRFSFKKMHETIKKNAENTAQRVNSRHIFDLKTGIEPTEDRFLSVLRNGLDVLT